MHIYYRNRFYQNYLYKDNVGHYTSFNTFNGNCIQVSYRPGYKPLSELETVYEISKEEFDQILSINQMSSYIAQDTLKSKLIRAF